MTPAVHKETVPTKRSLLPRAHPISWWMLLITTLAILLTSIDRQILPTVLPGIMKDFNLTEVQAGWLNSLSFIGSFVGAVIFGILADALGTGYKRSWTWVYAIGVATISGIVTFFNKTLFSLQIWRFIMGIGTGGSEPVNVALIGEWWQKEDRGFAIGVHHTGFPIGQFVGPVIMGAILAVAGWREAFLFVPLIGVPIMILQVVLGTKKNQERVYSWIKENGLTVPVDEEHPPEATGLKDAFKFVGIALRSHNVRMSIIMIFLFLWSEQGIATFMTTHLTEKVGLPLATAAVISGASGITGWIGQVVWGTLSDRLGRKFSLRIITVGWIAAVLAMIFINSAMTGWLILIGWGLFRNSPFPVAYALLIDSAPQAAASGMGLMIGIALGLSGFLVAPVSGWIIRNYGFTANYIMIAVSLLLAFIPMFLLKETVNTGQETA